MTAGRVKRIERYIGDDRDFLLTYGDGVGSVDINATVRFHRRHGRILPTTAVHPPGRFGELDLQKDGTVSGFNEKPQIEGGWISGGFFVVSRRLFSRLRNADTVMLEQGPMRKLTADGEVMARPHAGFWQPMDTYAEYTYLNRLWNEGRAPWKIW
jgi:glucose-1-phosphate cytidylyltransferase